MIHDLENRDLKNFQYFFLACNYSLTNQFMPIKFYMYFSSTKDERKLIQKSYCAGLLQFKGTFSLFYMKKKNINKKFTCALMFIQS